MSIAFTPERWNKVAANWSAWWAGKLERPIINLRMRCRQPDRPAAAYPWQDFTSNYDESVTPEQIVDAWDYELAHFDFLADGFPQVWPNYGPGVIAAFLGGVLEKQESTVWFHPAQPVELADLKFAYQPDNYWLGRLHAINQAAARRWRGQVQIGLTDLGGNLDILSSFRPGESLLLDLYDQPEAVKRLTWTAHELWWRYYQELQAAMQPNPGYSAWTAMFSREPYYMLQCDFAYMISPEMFKEFVLPELAASCRRLTNAFYHLDGPGQLPHLDHLLSIPELKGIQWIPGAGQKPCRDWPEIYQRIRAAGKLVQIFGTVEDLEILASKLGSARGLCLIGSVNGGVNPEDEQFARSILKRYGAE